MEFSRRAWKNIDRIYNSILSLPFVKELETGSLKREIFQYYMIQDAIYLGEFARVLAIVSAKAPEADIQLKFAENVSTAIVVERSLHENFFSEFGIIPEVALATVPSPTCLNYTNFLLATAYRDSFAVTLAAILPCFWIYAEVGKHIYQKGKVKDHPYQKWLDTYAADDFEASVNYAIAVTDKAAQTVSSQEIKLMERVFYRAAQFEWMFWDSAYRLEKWPVG